MGYAEAQILLKKLRFKIDAIPRLARQGFRFLCLRRRHEGRYRYFAGHMMTSPVELRCMYIETTRLREPRRKKQTFSSPVCTAPAGIDHEQCCLFLFLCITVGWTRKWPVLVEDIRSNVCTVPTVFAHARSLVIG